MRSSKEIQQLHAKLQKIFSQGKVYIGGSYLYGETTAESDVDFYFVGSILDCIFHKHQKELVADLKNRFPFFSIMLLPRLAVRLGIFYFYGHDIDGKLRFAIPNKRLIIGNCLKFAYYNYLRSLLGTASSARYLRKSFLQLAAARCIANDPDYSEPIFSRKYLRQHGDWYEGDFCSIAGELMEKLDIYLGFSIINYCIYNFRFAFMGDFIFLSKNPDRHIICQLREGLKNNQNFDKLFERIRRIIFPVIIL